MSSTLQPSKCTERTNGIRRSSPWPIPDAMIAIEQQKHPKLMVMNMHMRQILEGTCRPATRRRRHVISATARNMFDPVVCMYVCMFVYMYVMNMHMRQILEGTCRPATRRRRHVISATARNMFDPVVCMYVYMYVCCARVISATARNMFDPVVCMYVYMYVCCARVISATARNMFDPVECMYVCIYVCMYVMHATLETYTHKTQEKGSFRSCVNEKHIFA